jgi:hypothetical protein
MDERIKEHLISKQTGASLLGSGSGNDISNSSRKYRRPEEISGCCGRVLEEKI